MTEDIPRIALNMIVRGLPETFVLRTVALARESEGVEDMLHLWNEFPSERDAIVAELQAALDNRELSSLASEVESAPDAERVLDERLRLKAHIRSLVEARGGVQRVAELAGLPQPSLSRFLNTPSEPRPATLHRLARAMRVAVADLTPGIASTAVVYELDRYRSAAGYQPHPRYGHREARG